MSSVPTWLVPSFKQRGPSVKCLTRSVPVSKYMTIGTSALLHNTCSSARLSHAAAATKDSVALNAQEDDIAAIDTANGKARAGSPPASLVSMMNNKHDVIHYLTSRRRVIPFHQLQRRLQELDLQGDPVILDLLISQAVQRRLSKMIVPMLQQLVNSREASRADISRTFEMTAGSLASREQWDLLLPLTSLALSRRVASANLIKARMRALYKQQRFLDCISAFELFERHGISADGDAYDELVGAHLLAGNLNVAQTILNTKSELGFPTTTKTVLSLIDGMWLYGGNKEMEGKVLHESTESDLIRQQALCQDTRVLHRIMSVRAARGDYEDALAVVPFFDIDDESALAATIREIVPSHSLTPAHRHTRPRIDLTAIGILMGIATRKQLHSVSQRLLLDSQRCNLGLNESVVNAYVKDLLAMEEVDAAVQFVWDLSQGRAVLHDLRDMRTSVTLPPFRSTRLVDETLFRGVLSRQGPGEATMLLASKVEDQGGTRKRGRVFTQGMMSALVDWITRNGKLTSHSSARLVVRAYEMVSGRIRPTIKEYNRLLAAAWREDRRNRAKQSTLPLSDNVHGSVTQPLASLVIDNVDMSPDHDTVFNVFRLQSTSAPPDHLWQFMQTSILDRGMRPTARHVTTIIMAYIRLGDPDGAEQALHHGVNSLRVRPHISMFTSLIDGLSKLGYHDRAMNAYQRLKHDFLDKQDTTNAALEGEGEGSRLVRDDFVKLDRHGFATLCMVCARQRDVRGVELVWNQARLVLDQQQRPDDKTMPSIELDPVFVSIMYRVLCMTNQVDRAQEFLSTKLDKGLVPDQVLLKMLHRTRRWTNRHVNSLEDGRATEGSRWRRTSSTTDIERIQQAGERLYDRAKQVYARHESERTGSTGPKGGEAAALKQVKQVVQG
ncbi:hypothetical protein ACM66B_003064 [Microbotryomycetes sp. NB124-2]